jgi:hypothetical protein
MNRVIVGSILICAFGGCSSTHTPASNTLPPPDVPDAIKAPADEHVAGRYHIVAVQTFTCQAAASADGGAPYAWTPTKLDAKIEDWDTNAVIGVHTHSPAPTFTANDGSSVVVKNVAQVPSPTGAGEPWLLLSVVSHSGTGMFSNVTSLQRINTAGESSPQATCNATTDPTAQQAVNGSSDFYYYAK